METLSEIINDIILNTPITMVKGLTGKANKIKTCPYCRNGESGKSRSFILKDGNKATFICHKGNCPSGGSKSLGLFAKDQGYMKGLINYMEFIKGSGIEFNTEEKELDLSNSLSYKSIDLSKEINVLTSNENFKKTILAGVLDNTLLSYLYLKRKIQVDLKDKMLRNTKNGNLLIPYYNKTLDDVYYVQERTKKGDYFFLNLEGYEDNDDFIFKKIYNLYNVDEDKPIIAFEGVFDTYFVSNSISIGGCQNYNILEKLKLFYGIDNIYYIQDNDEAGKKSAIKYMKEGGYVFQWYLFLRDNNINTYVKDFNDLFEKDIIKRRFTFSDLECYFTNNTNLINFI